MARDYVARAAQAMSYAKKAEPKAFALPAQAFEDVDVNAVVRLNVAGLGAVGAWLTSYAGPSSFVRSVADQARRKGSITMPQFDAVEREYDKAFEAVQAEYARLYAPRPVVDDNAAEFAMVNAEVAADKPAATEIPNGYYTVVFDDGSYVTLRISEWKAKGATVVGYLAGPDNSSDYVGFGFVNNGKLAIWNKFRGKLDRQVKAFDILAGNVAEAGEAYAMRSSNCFRCNRRLSVPTSLHRGLGPECAGKIGL